MDRDEGRGKAMLARTIQQAKSKIEVVEIVSTDPKQVLFADVKSARGRAKGLDLAAILQATEEINDTTRKQYDRIIRRRLPASGPDLAGLTRASFYPARAAIKSGLAERVNIAMTAQDRAQRAGDYTTAAKEVRKALDALQQLEELQAIKPPAAVKVQNSARQRLPKSKGESWQARVYGAATEKMRPAIAVMWATGARPAEVQKGIDLERVEGGLRVRIPGSKVNNLKHSGQPVRVLLIKEDTPAGRALAAVLGDAEKVVIQRKASRITKDFCDHIRPRLPASYQVSAYSFRHQASANMKADFQDAAKVATAMGHRTTRSQQHYGTARQSQSGGGAVLDARATHQPKETRGMVNHPPRGPGSSPGLSL